MCAIFGIFGEYEEKKALLGFSKLSHRGEDFCNIVRENNLFFAHHRLTIEDNHQRSNQPFKYGDILLSFNGEIYNFKELKEELKQQFYFKTDGDSEVIIASYLKWGLDFVKHLRGMFAIALKDKDKLYLFRDRLGKKPIFYMKDNKAFYFSSEIKGLKPFLKNINLDEDAMLSYLSFLAPTPPHTFYKNIKKLSAGEFLEFNKNKIEVKRYFDILDTQKNIITNEDEAIPTLENILKKSIQLRIDTSVSMASLLSGGIDSASISYFSKYFGKDIPTYTLGYKEFAKYDERINAKESAKILGVENIEVEIDQQKFIDTIDIVFDTLDEPLNDPASIPLYLLFEKIKDDGHKVVLSGEGSDELFLGYRQYFEYLDVEKASSLLHKNWLKKYFHKNFSMNREWEWYKRIFDGTVLFRTSGDKFTDLQKNVLFKRNIKDNESLKYLQPYLDRFNNSKFDDKSIWYSYIDLNIFQAEHFLTKLDRVSMAHSIESRTPFLDHNLVETIFSIDPQLRYKDGVTKSLLKKMMQPYLGDKILSRKKKGFSNPYMEYLIASNKINLIKDVNKKTNFFKDDIIERYIQNASKGRFKQHVWGLYALSHWIDKNL